MLYLPKDILLNMSYRGAVPNSRSAALLATAVRLA